MDSVEKGDASCCAPLAGKTGTPLDTNGDGVPDYRQLHCNDANCDVCSAADTCTTCKSGHLLNNGACTLLCNDANCDTCSAADTCTTCNAGYILDTSNDGTTTSATINNGACKLICNDANCDICSAANTCTTCKTGYEVDANGACAFMDSDSDGIPDLVECPTLPNNCVDTDNDNTPDYRDDDSDGDGISDIVEKGNDGNNPMDTDNDETPDYRDDDSDGDGISDSIEKGSPTAGTLTGALFTAHDFLSDNQDLIVVVDGGSPQTISVDTNCNTLVNCATWLDAQINGASVSVNGTNPSRLSDQVNIIDTTNLNGAYSVAVSPDGKNVYAVARKSKSIVHWDRDSSTGALTNQVVLIDATNLDGASCVIVSPDGKNVYAVAETSKSIVHWDRDASTGALTNQVVLIHVLFDGARTVIVSPDGLNVYAAGGSARRVFIWDRDATTGALTNFFNVQDSVNLRYVKSLAVSPDGKHVYAASSEPMDGKGIIVYWNRGNAADCRCTREHCCLVHPQNSVSGALTEKKVLEVPRENGKTILCAISSVTVSPDGKNVYAVGTGSHSIARWSRDSSTGALTNQVVEFVPQGWLQGISVSPDGKNVYAVGYSSIVHWDRDSSDGALTNRVAKIDRTTLLGGERVTVSPDGKNVYAALSVTLNSIVYWNRDAFAIMPWANLKITSDTTGLSSMVSITASGSGADALALFDSNPVAENGALVDTDGDGAPD